MSTQSNLRHRKQRFPRQERRKFITPLIQHSPTDDFESDEDSVCANKSARHSVLPINRLHRITKTQDPKESSLSACRLDKRARDEHNEQERSRRRELAVIYELIRYSFSDDDLRYLGTYNGPKSTDKLSYPQVLQIAYHLICEEQHNLILFEKYLNDVKRIEKEFVRAGLSAPERPPCPSIADNYRRVVQLVDNLLKVDKSARSIDGVYEVTPAERAAVGDQELSYLRPRSNRFGIRSSHNSSTLFPNRRSSGALMNYLDSFSEDSRSCISTSQHQHSLKRSCSAASMSYVSNNDLTSSLSPLSSHYEHESQAWINNTDHHYFSIETENNGILKYASPNNSNTHSHM